MVKKLLYLIGVNFALRGGGDEHKKIHRPGCNPQIENHADEDGVECLRFTDDLQFKTNQGGLTRKLAEPKVVICYKNRDLRQCLVRLFNKYVGLLQNTNKATCLYLRSERKPLIKFIFLYVVRICGIRNNVEHLCNSNLLLYSMYICTSRNLLQCCTSNSNVV